MDLRQLEIIRAIADTGSFTAAGEKLHVSQSAISRQILLLEDELGEPVFHRIGRRIRITAAGESLLQLSHRVFQDLQETVSAISDKRESLSGTMRLVGGMTVCLYVFPALLAEVRRVHPHLDLKVTVGSAERSIAMLRSGLGDLGMITLPVEATDLVSVPVLEEELLLVTYPEHPLAKKKSIVPADLDRQDFVLLAPIVGAFADSMPKGRVMLITNGIKIFGCALMLIDTHPLLSYAIVGFGAAAYSPAKYGILTELLPPQQLVVANGWIEGATVGSIILGVLLGGALITPRISAALLGFDAPMIQTPVDTAPEAAIAVIMAFYLIAAVFNWYIPDTGVDHRVPSKNPLYLVREFSHCVALLWRDRLGQISLATTTLFWGAGATLQFIVIDWAARALSLNLSQASMLQGVVAIGIALGAVIAARFVSLRGSVNVLPIGAVMGLVVIVMVVVHYIPLAMLLMVAIGACAGFFVVPMNALLQHRGHVLMGAGHSIAVQNFNENIGILVMVGLYAMMVRAGISVSSAIVLFGLFVTSTMLLVMWRHRANQRQYDSLHLIGMDKP